jgi:hypothetical protein
MNKRELKTKMLAVLKDTVEFYSDDVNRRAVTRSGDCLYYDNKCDTKCAIGRLLNKRDIQYLIDQNQLEGYGIHEVFGCLTSKKIKELPLSFLRDLQNLHDEEEYWDSFDCMCITKAGIREAKKIEKKIRTDKYFDNPLDIF